MNVNDMIKLTVGVVVGVLMLSAILVPLIHTSTDTTKTYVNEGTYYSLADADDTDTHTIVISTDNLPAVSVDGTLVTAQFDEYTLVFGQHSILRFTATTGRLILGGSLSEGTSLQWATLRAANSEDDATIVLTGTTMTVTVGETVTTIEDNWAYIDPAGDFSYCISPCVLADSPIYGGGATYTPFTSVTVICFTGTSEGLTNYGVYRSSPTVTIDDVVINTSEVDGDLIKIDSIVFNCTQSETSKTATYTYFLAPKEITYDNPDYVGSDIATIMSVIPMLVTVGIIVGIVGVAFSRRE